MSKFLQKLPRMKIDIKIDTCIRARYTVYVLDVCVLLLYIRAVMHMLCKYTLLCYTASYKYNA